MNSINDKRRTNLPDDREAWQVAPGVWSVPDAVVQNWIDGGFGSAAFGSMRCVITRANGQLAVAAVVAR